MWSEWDVWGPTLNGKSHENLRYFGTLPGRIKEGWRKVKNKMIEK